MELYVRSDSVVSRVIAGETLIIPVRRGVGDLASIYALNEVASAIWDALAQPRSKEQIVRALAEEFDAATEQIASDVDSFLAEMQPANLITSLREPIAA
jgi:hypothetical protein